ncbi:P-loop NTPase fold protein [Dysgonomonas capnocytophagoides]|uniref:P-loop NTPase fold protein n=1 Tax=Dysgonomonas capnocytophagoides TaxID=45254 RepID=UPI003341CF5A
MVELSIYIEDLYNHFKSHLDNNKRILFSGPYGIGKTYFLRDFFKNENIETDYNVFHLFPVNYQVSNNEDIFELIKIDILYHILGKGWEFEEQQQEKISKTLALQTYTISKTSSAFKAITQILSLGKSKPITEGADELEKIITSFSKYYKELNEEEYSLDKIKEFADVFEKKKGSIYEFDNITQLISELLEKQTSVENQADETDIKKKENVLIIDDLDRIDPEHIFRILNVFSAHFDIRNEDSNKFGFDKVIFVCDIENIRNIFSAKYGCNTDFNGYINKFFSSHIYHFENKTEIKETIEKFLDRKLTRREVHKRYTSIKEDIIEFLGIFIDSERINIRHLKNLETFDFSISFYDYYRREHITRLLYWHLINFLLKIFSNDLTKLKGAFSNLKLDDSELRSFNRRKDRYLKGIILLADIEKVNDHFQGQKVDYLYKNRDLDLRIRYSLINTGDYFWSDIQDVISFDSEEFSSEANADPVYGIKKFTRDISLEDIGRLFVVAISELDRKGMLIRK